MGSLFSMDGPIYKFCNYIYYLLIGNILWFICSIPLVTIGASTTALFYVMGKVARGEDVSMTKDFFKSFKLNFKQATISWLILAVGYFILIVSIRNVGVAYGSMGRYVIVLQWVLLAELVMANIYIFPVLSRCVVSTAQLFKISFFMGNRHLITTFFCGGAIYVLAFILLPKVPGLFLFISVALYALYASFMIEKVLQRYLPKADEEGSEGIIEQAEVISDEVVASDTHESTFVNGKLIEGETVKDKEQE